MGGIQPASVSKITKESKQQTANSRQQFNQRFLGVPANAALLSTVCCLLFAVCLTQSRQIVKRQLRIVDLLSEFSVTNSVSRDVQRFTHGVEMETDYMRCDPNGRDAPLASKPSHR